MISFENHIAVDSQSLGEDLALMLGIQEQPEIHDNAILNPELIHDKVNKELNGLSLGQAVVGDQRQLGGSMVGGGDIFRITNMTTQDDRPEGIHGTNNGGLTGSIGSVDHGGTQPLDALAVVFDVE